MALVCDEPKSHGGAIVITMMITACLTVIGFALVSRYRYYKYEARVSAISPTYIFKVMFRIPTVKLKIPGKAFLKSESRTSVTFKL